MSTGVSVSVSSADRRRLEAITADRNTAQKYLWRARIILLTADGVGTMGIMAATGRSKTTVWRWQERFAEAGVDGLLVDKTRPPGKAPISEARVGEVLRLTRTPPSHEATHWTARAMAKAAGMGTVQKIWRSHGLAPHRWRTVQALHRPGLRREAPRCRRAVHRSAGARGGPQHRREEPDPGARPHPAGPADEEGPRRP